MNEDFSFRSDLFLRFLEMHGSVRLVNVFRASLDEVHSPFQHLFPYENYSDFERDTVEARIGKLNRLPNLGKRSIKEFFALIDKYHADGSSGTKTELEHESASIRDFSFESASFREFIEIRGSVRLVNVFKTSFERGHFPYKAYSGFERDSVAVRQRKLSKLPNLGKKSIKEFFDLIENYLAKGPIDGPLADETILAFSEGDSFQSDSFFDFLKRKASARVLDCFKTSLVDNSFPYREFEQFDKESAEAQTSKLSRLQNLGDHGAHELLGLMNTYRSINTSQRDDYCVRQDLPLTSVEFLEYLRDNASKWVFERIDTSLASGSFPYTNCTEVFRDVHEERVRKLVVSERMRKRDAIDFLVCLIKFAKDRFGAQWLLNTASGAEKADDAPPVSALGQMHRESAGFDPDSPFTQLTERERTVVEGRYGLRDGNKMTLEELASELGVTRERIRQIQVKALKKLAWEADAWSQYLAINQQEALDEFFADKLIITDAREVGGWIGLAIAIVDNGKHGFLGRVAETIGDYWVHPNLDIGLVQKSSEYILNEFRDNEESHFPMRVAEVSKRLEATNDAVRAAVEMVGGYTVYEGYITKGRATPRKRRTINILTLYDSSQIPSPCDLWEMKRAYWMAYKGDRCGGRDLFMCLEDHPHHFVNLRELGWMVLRDGQASVSNKLNVECLDEGMELPGLFEEPVKDSDGLVNKLFRMFEEEGPMRLKHAAVRFQDRYPEYAASSMYPMMVVYAVFVRLAPGVIGIRNHLRDDQWLEQARENMLNLWQIDLYLLASLSSPPQIIYPLWDARMEQNWCSWLFEREDYDRLGQLLGCVDIECWELERSEKTWWLQQRARLLRKVTEPAVVRFEDRYVKPDVFFVALAAASISGETNWMQINQGLGWRIETTRVVLVIAMLVQIGALRPSGKWFETHALTDKGKEIFSDLFEARGGEDESNIVLKELRNHQLDARDPSWADQYSFEELMEKVTGSENIGINAVDVRLSSVTDEDDELDLDSFYSAISNKHLDELLEESDGNPDV